MNTYKTTPVNPIKNCVVTPNMSRYYMYPHVGLHEQRGGGNIPKTDPYRKYTGQEGHNIKDCVSYDEQNLPRVLCKMTVNMTQRQPATVADNYLSLNDSISERILSCQNMAPTYYPNMVVEMIGKRPVYAVRNCEYNIPEIIIKNRDNLVAREFSCYQPNWCWNCM